MSGEFSQLLNNYFYNFIIIENEEVNINKNEKLKQYEKYNISKFVIEKVSSFSDKHCSILTSLYFPSQKEELEKMNIICDYYIEGNLISKIYNQLKGIFTKIAEQSMNNIISVLNAQIKLDNENELNEIQENGGSTEKLGKKDTKENEKENDLNNINGNNDKNEICILMCLLLSKNKLIEAIISFIEVLIKKINNNDNIDLNIKNNILKEIQEIQLEVNKIIKNALINKVQRCLHLNLSMALKTSF